ALEALPLARLIAVAAVVDQSFWPLGHLGVEVVHQQPLVGLLAPALGRPGGPARRPLGCVPGHVRPLLRVSSCESPRARFLVRVSSCGTTGCGAAPLDL